MKRTWQLNPSSGLTVTSRWRRHGIVTFNTSKTKIVTCHHHPAVPKCPLTMMKFVLPKRLFAFSTGTVNGTHIYELSINMVGKTSCCFYRFSKYLTADISGVELSSLHFPFSSSEASSQPCEWWIIWDCRIYISEANRHKAFTTLSLFPRPLFEQAPFFSSTSSDHYSQDTLCNSRSNESTSFPSYSKILKASSAENSSFRTLLKKKLIPVWLLTWTKQSWSVHVNGQWSFFLPTFIHITSHLIHHHHSDYNPPSWLSLAPLIGWNFVLKTYPTNRCSSKYNQTNTVISS